jgi:hypothetical protein
MLKTLFALQLAAPSQQPPRRQRATDRLTNLSSYCFSLKSGAKNQNNYSILKFGVSHLASNIEDCHKLQTANFFKKR